MKKIFLFSAAALAVLGLTVVGYQANAFERSAMSIQFNPAEDTETRYLFTLHANGTYITPGGKDQIEPGEYAISTLFKDSVTESLPGQNRHKINFYSYDVRSVNFGSRDRNDSRFGNTPFPNMGGGGGGGGDEGGDEGGGGGGGGGGGDGPVSAPNPNSFVGSLGLPGKQPGGGGGVLGGHKQMQGPQQNRGQGQPMQGQGPPGGGGGGRAGADGNKVKLDSILINEIDYVTNKQGEILDVGGLDLLRKVSQNSAVTEEDEQDEDKTENYIDINIGHIFEWTHMLYLPTHPVYKEDIWFHSLPIHVPGLPAEQPVLTKFMYKLLDFRTVGTRKVAVIDMSGVCEWNHEWESQNKLNLTEFKSWGNMGISARIWFDYEKNVIFAMERPFFVDWQYQRGYAEFAPYGPDGIPYAQGLNPFTQRYPGLVISMEFFYNTRETDISGKPRLVEVQPEEKRRYIVMNLIGQLEAE